eukprot:g55171.t1
MLEQSSPHMRCPSSSCSYRLEIASSYTKDTIISFDACILLLVLLMPHVSQVSLTRNQKPRMHGREPEDSYSIWESTCGLRLMSHRRQLRTAKGGNRAATPMKEAARAPPRSALVLKLLFWAGLVLSSAVGALYLFGVPSRSPRRYSASTPGLRWGTLTPAHFFGVRAMEPTSPWMLLSWAGADAPRGRLTGGQLPRQRAYTTSQHKGIGRYEWEAHDGRGYGVEVVEDKSNNLRLTLSFLARDPSQVQEGQDAWLVRIEGQPLSAKQPVNNISLAWHMGMRDRAHAFSQVRSASGEWAAPTNTLDGHGLPGDVSVRMELGVLGHYTLHMPTHPANTHPTASFRLRKPEGGERMDRTYFGTLICPPEAAIDDCAGADYERMWDQQLQNDYDYQLRGFQHWQQSLPQQSSSEGSPLLADIPAIFATLPNALATTPPAPPGQPAPPPQQQPLSQLSLQRLLVPPFRLDLVLTRSLPSGPDPPPSPQSFRDAAYADGALAAAREHFTQRFTQTFSKLQADGTEQTADDKRRFAQATLASLLGGIGYFYGDEVIQHPGMEQPRLSNKHALFSATPSRAAFPRGFLWDEGFHQLLVSRWDHALSLEMLASWTALIDKQGWVAREQILGAEARRIVPEQFVVQSAAIANPPTQVLALHRLLQRARADANNNASASALSAVTAFLHTHLPALSRQRTWYLRTQAASLPSQYVKQHGALRCIYACYVRAQAASLPSQYVKQHGAFRAFRWKDRSLEHCLSSGLDDYPRAAFLTENEGHVDLLSWLVALTDAHADFLAALGQDDQALRAEAVELRRALLALHWDQEQALFCDFAFNATKTNKLMVCRKGYVSLFPLALRLLDAHDPTQTQMLGAVLTLLADREELWSDFGVLSLSRKDAAWHSKEDYWRGHIWIPVNFLLLDALHHYGYQTGAHAHQTQCQQLYEQLRANLVQNVYKQYQQTGYIWEQYSSEDGAGRRGHPFTGWSALVVLMMEDWGQGQQAQLA